MAFPISLGDRIAAPLQAGANRASIGIGARAPFGGAFIDLLLRHLRLLLRIGIRGRAHDGSGRAAKHQARARIARAADNRTNDGAGNGAADRIPPGGVDGCTITRS